MTSFKSNTAVAAFGRQRKGSAADFGYAASFVLPVVVALNRVNFVAITKLLVLHVCGTARCTVGHMDSRLDG